jgi:AAA family ATPase
VSSQSYDKKTSEDLAFQLERLEIDLTPRIWTVGWDTAVVVLPADVLEPPESVKVRTIFPPDACGLHQRKQNQLTATDPYTAVGGLDKQISQIRDLVDIPLTRPDLFQHFG